MAKFTQRQQALLLRQQGKSYSQIKSQLHVSKSTLSNWLREYPLTKEQIRLLRDVNVVRIERYQQAMMQKRLKRYKNYYAEAKHTMALLSKRELLIAGLFLYWGEGNKNLQGPVSVSNTDPSVLIFIKKWLLSCWKIATEKIKIHVHLYSDMDKEKELDYWSNLLHIPLSQFTKPYIKESTRQGIHHKGFGHGTCTLFVNDVRLKEKVIMLLKATVEHWRYVAVI